MIRVILINLLLLLLPFIVYFAYVYLVRSGSKPNEPITMTPLIVLFAIGLALMTGAVVYFIQFETGQPGQRYIPPQVKDGVLQPGRLE
jgi:hypothetical protein